MSYLCFGLDPQNPKGGMRDCWLITNDYDKAVEWLEKQQNHFDYVYIYDLVQDKTICVEDLCT